MIASVPAVGLLADVAGSLLAAVLTAAVMIAIAGTAYALTVVQMRCGEARHDTTRTSGI